MCVCVYLMCVDFVHLYQTLIRQIQAYTLKEGQHVRMCTSLSGLVIYGEAPKKFTHHLGKHSWPIQQGLSAGKKGTRGSET